VFLSCFFFALPNKLFNAPTSFVLTDCNGTLLSARIAKDGQWRFPLIEPIPEKFEKCITTFEDKRFYYHFGVDIIAIGRASWQNLRHKKTISGGSTISMQVIRLYKNHKSRTWWNKIVESVLAVRLECSYKKKSILSLYASNAPFGGNIIGLDAASWRYFGRPPTQLSWGEMAVLAVLPNAPAMVHPNRNKETLIAKRNSLIDKLFANKTISQSEAELAKLEPIPSEPKILPQIAPHLLDRVIRDYNNPASGIRSTSIQTTVDVNLQLAVNNILLQHHATLKGNQINNACAMVTEIETGAIKVYIGNVYLPQSADLESHVDVLSANRSPGSTLKPLLYASMLTEGQLLPKQLIPDVPTQIGGYAPQNFDLGYDGAVPANQALSRSLNIPAVKLLQQFKYQRFYEVLHQCGFSTLTQSADHYGMSMILGGCEVTPFELAGVYSSMARMYNHQKINHSEWNRKDWFMPKYTLNTSTIVDTKKTDIALFDYPSIWHTLNAMNEVMRPGDEGLWGLFTSSHKIAWKTGTSFGFRDGWAIGLTPKYAVVVWVGNTTGVGRPSLTGINTAAPILFDIFSLLPYSEWFKQPIDKVNYIATCSKSGFKASRDCEKSDTIMVSESAKNAPICPYCRKINVDASLNYRVTDKCESPSNMKQLSWFILPPTIEYYYKQKQPSYKLLPPYKVGCEVFTTKMLDIIYPEEGSIIFIPMEGNGQKGKTVFKATHRENGTRLFWHLDQTYIATTTQFHQIEINPSIGKHILSITDEFGNSISRNFEILSK